MNEWKLPDSWESEPLGHIADIVFSNVDKKTVPGEKPVVLCNYMDVYSNEYITHHLDFMEATANPAEIARFSVQKGDVIATKDSETPDEIGIPAVVVEDISNLVCGYHLAQIKPRREFVDPVFLSKQIAHDRISRYLSRLANGSTRYGLSTNSFEEMPVWLPLLQKQRKIARILTTLDELIEKTEALIAKYQVIKKGLMHDLFTRGVDEYGNLRPSYQDAPELYKESNRGRYPEVWDHAPLCEYAEVSGGVTLGRKLKGNATVEMPYLRVANVQDGYLDLAEIKTVEVLKSEIGRYRLQPGDVVMTEGGDFDKLGRGTIWNDEINPCLHQNHIFRIRSISDELNPQFLAHLTASAYGCHYFLLCAKQTTNLASINATQVKAFPLLLPTPEEQSAIVDQLGAIDCLINVESSTLKKLMLQKNGLMQDLLTGEVEVTLDENEFTYD